MSHHAATPGSQGTAAAPSAVPIWQQAAWPTAIILGALALARPVAGMVARAGDTELGPWGAGIIAVVSLVWIVVATCRRVAAVPTLIAAGLIQAVGAAALAFFTTWAFDGMPAGPLVHPTELALLVGAGALWGLVCGALALAFQRARDGYGLC